MATTTASRRHGRWSMPDLPRSLRGRLLRSLCFLRRRTNDVWYGPYELSKSRVLFPSETQYSRFACIPTPLSVFFVADASYRT